MAVKPIIIRYADGTPYPVAKQPRPKLCGKCGAFATHAVEELIPISILDLNAVLKRSSTVRTTYWCSYHIKTA